MIDINYGAMVTLGMHSYCSEPRPTVEPSNKGLDILGCVLLGGHVCMRSGVGTLKCMAPTKQKHLPTSLVQYL